MADLVRVTLRGDDELLARFVRLRFAAPVLTGRSLYRFGLGVMRLSKEQVPVRTGTLKNEGTVLPPVVAGGRVTVELGYGGAASAYALAVHEIPPPELVSPGERSARHAPGKKWKYLEDPLKEAAGRLEKELGADLKAGLGRETAR